jgi:hypothetical protein
MMLTATAVGLAAPGVAGLVAGAIAGAAAFGGIILLTPERFMLLAART